MLASERESARQKMVEEGKVVSPLAGREKFPDSLKRLVSITKQISATTYNTYDSPQFNPHRSPGKKKKNTRFCPHGRAPSTPEWNKLCFLGCRVWEEGASVF